MSRVGGLEPAAARSRVVWHTGRAALVLAAFVWASYFATSFRTSDYGVTLRDAYEIVLATLIFSLPAAPFAFIGLGWRWGMIGFLAVCVASLIVAEVFGRTQELLVVRRFGAHPAQTVNVSRWWPFGHHNISYTPGEGWWGCD